MGPIIFYNVYNNSGICLPGVTKNVYSNLVAGRGGQKKKFDSSTWSRIMLPSIDRQMFRRHYIALCIYYVYIIYSSAFVAVNKQIRFCYSKPSETGLYCNIHTLYRCICRVQLDFARVVLLSRATYYNDNGMITRP